MRFRCDVLLAGLLLVGAASLQAFDFQLYSSMVEEDGFKHEQLFFRDGDHGNILVAVPAGWERTAEPGSLTMTAPGMNDTMVRLEKSPFAPDLLFKDKSLDTYRRQVVAAIPPGATETRISEEHAEPLPIFHWKSYEFVVDYVFYGRAFRRSMVFLDLNAREQILVTSVGPAASYDRAHGAAFDLLRSWQVMPTR